LAHEAGGVLIANLLKQANLVPSTSEANRSIEQGAVRIGGERVSERTLRVGPGVHVVQVGKRRWARVTIA
jgi:tyrosyl-tRNA synthetase